MTRAISVAAPVEVIWRWLCQIAVAPYSYDWIDNRGRRSPRSSRPAPTGSSSARRWPWSSGWSPSRTATSGPASPTPRGERLFGPVAMTYAAEPDGAGPGSSAGWRSPRTARGRRAKAYALAWGDLVMMRKQFLTLKELAERDAMRGTPASTMPRLTGEPTSRCPGRQQSCSRWSRRECSSFAEAQVGPGRRRAA